MSNNNNDRIKIASPKGVAVFPRLNQPDTKFKAEGEYTVKLAFAADDEDYLKLKARLEKIRDEQFAKFISENPKKKRAEVADVFTLETDKEGDETGRELLTFKMRASGVSKKTGKPFTLKPAIFNAAKSDLTDNPPSIGGGSVLRVNFEPSGAFVESAKKFYLSLRMNGVQIIELKEFGGRSADSMGFDEEEGYDGEGAEKPSRNSSSESGDEDGDAHDFD